MFKGSEKEYKRAKTKIGLVTLCYSLYFVYDLEYCTPLFSFGAHISTFSGLIVATVVVIGLFRYDNWFSGKKESQRMEAMVNCYRALEPYVSVLDAITDNEKEHWRRLLRAYQTIGTDPEFGDSVRDGLKKRFVKWESDYKDEICSYKKAVTDAILFFDSEQDQELRKQLTHLSGELGAIKNFYHGVPSKGRVKDIKYYCSTERSSRVNDLIVRLEEEINIPA